MGRLREALAIIQHDFACATRGVRRSPGITVAVTLTLALGIGVNATMFAVVDRLLLKPPAHVEDADQVRRLYVQGRMHRSSTISTQSYLSYPDFVDWLEASSFASVATYATEEKTLGRGEDARRVAATFATASFFPLLGVQPALGRFFDESDDRAGAPGVVVLSHGFWQRHFGGDASVLGRNLDIGRGSYAVIGVTPARFTGIDLAAVDVWLPIHALTNEEGSDDWQRSRGWYWLQTIVRLSEGVALQAAETEATHLHRSGRRERIEAGRWDPDITVVAASILQARGPEASAESLVARWLLGVSLVVLLIACANVASLLLAQGLRRRKDMAVRLALGISRSRLVGQLLTESVLLAVLGAAAALLLAAWGAELLRGVFLQDVAWTESAVNPRVLAFAAVLSVVAGLASGFVPAIQASRPGLTEELKSGARETPRRSKLGLALLVAQGALSVVLLVGAGLFVRSLQKVEAVDLGVDAEKLLIARLDLEPRERTEEEVSRIYERALERLRALPVVERASASTGIPFWMGSIERLYVPGLDSIPAPAPGPWIDGVTPQHFAALGIPIRRGRDFGEYDDAQAVKVAIVSEAMARGIWGGDDPLGKCLLIGSPEAECAEVVGVVGDSHRQFVVEGEQWQYYVALAQYPEYSPGALFVRGRAETDELAPVVRRELVAADPEIRFALIQPLRDYIDPELRSFKLGATMFVVFGLLALIVAGLGLYSVLAFNVAQRIHEIGIRSALGASRRRVIRQVLAEAVAVTAVGLGIGLGVALAAGGAAAPLLYEVSPRDPAVLGAVVVILLVVAAAAGAIPASRASRVDPVEALRAE